MKILLATPLYPPEIAPVAQYVKELARRLKDIHEITILAYAYIPEQIPGVHIVTIQKDAFLPLRIIKYLTSLFSLEADIIYALNGASIELPVGIFTYFRHTNLIYCIGDQNALNHGKKSVLFRTIQRLLQKKAYAVIETIPSDRPEILPLEPRPDGALATWEQEWKKHIEELNSIFTHVKH